MFTQIIKTAVMAVGMNTIVDQSLRFYAKNAAHKSVHAQRLLYTYIHNDAKKILKLAENEPEIRMAFDEEKTLYSSKMNHPAGKNLRSEEEVLRDEG